MWKVVFRSSDPSWTSDLMNYKEINLYCWKSVSLWWFVVIGNQYTDIKFDSRKHTDLETWAIREQMGLSYTVPPAAYETALLRATVDVGFRTLGWLENTRHVHQRSWRTRGLDKHDLSMMSPCWRTFLSFMYICSEWGIKNKRQSNKNDQKACLSFQ